MIIEDLNNKQIKTFIIIFWLILASLYLSHTPQGHRNHDFGGQIEYTQILSTKHRFPTPHEGWQTYQPPLYYLINLITAPSIEKSQTVHIDFVRILSILYGAIALWFIADFLQYTNLPVTPRLISLLFIATIPKFYFIFSTYNNDSLVTMLIISMFSITHKLYKNWSIKLASLLLIISTAALYTKYTAVLGISVLLLLLFSKNILNKKLLDFQTLKIAGILIFSVILFTPWIGFHNYALTKKLFPTNAENGLGTFLAINDDRPLEKVLFRIPFLQQDPHEWDDPWAHGYTRPESKKHDYLAFSFLTSIYGEVVYEKPEIKYFWILIWIHLLCIIISLKFVLNNHLSKLAGALIFLGYFVQSILIFAVPESQPAACTMDYRYICWVWLAWSVLYSNALAGDSIWSWLLKRAMLIGIVIQIYTILTMSGNTS